MPFISITTNAEVSADNAKRICSAPELAVSAVPEEKRKALMTDIGGDKPLYFRGTDEPAAMVMVSLDGRISGNAMSILTANITGIMLDVLGISTDRVYVGYTSPKHRD